MSEIFRTYTQRGYARLNQEFSCRAGLYSEELGIWADELRHNSEFAVAAVIRLGCFCQIGIALSLRPFNQLR